MPPRCQWSALAAIKAGVHACREVVCRRRRRVAGGKHKVRCACLSTASVDAGQAIYVTTFGSVAFGDRRTGHVFVAAVREQAAGASVAGSGAVALGRASIRCLLRRIVKNVPAAPARTVRVAGAPRRADTASDPAVRATGRGDASGVPPATAPVVPKRIVANETGLVVGDALSCRSAISRRRG